MKRITYTEISKRYGVTKTTILKWVDGGHIPFEVDERGKRFLHEETAIPAIEHYLKHRYPNPNQSNASQKISGPEKKDNKFITTSAINQAKAVREQYNSRMARLNYETKCGELIKRDVVEKRVFELILQVRDSIMLIGEKIAPELASMKNVKQITTLIDDMHREALQACSEMEFDKWRKKLKSNKR